MALRKGVTTVPTNRQMFKLSVLITQDQYDKALQVCRKNQFESLSVRGTATSG